MFYTSFNFLFLLGFCSCKRSISPKNVIGYIEVVFFQTSQTKFLLNDGTWFTIAFQQNIHYYRFCSHCFQALLIIGIFLFAKATLSVSEKIHLPWSANEWSLIWERTLISYDSSSNLTHLGVESMGDTLLNWCQLKPNVHWSRKFISSALSRFYQYAAQFR